MSDYKSLTARECAEILLKAENPTVVMHRRPDGDAAGSAAALIEIFKALGKEASYACADPIPQRLAFLLEGKKMAGNLDGCTIITIDVASADQLGALKDKIPSPVLMIDHHAVGAPFADNFILPDASSAAEVLMHVIDELIKMEKL